MIRTFLKTALIAATTITATPSFALDIGSQVDGMSEAYENMRSIVRENKEEIWAELQIKEAIVYAIEKNEDLAEFTGVLTLDGNAKHIVIPASIGTMLLTKYAVNAADTVIKAVTPANKFAAWSAGFKDSKRQIKKLNRQIRVANKKPAVNRALITRLQRSLSNAKLRKLEFVSNKPGVIYRSLRGVRHIGRFAIRLGAVGIGLATIGQVSVVYLDSDKVDSVKDNFKSDIFELERLLNDAGEFETEDTSPKGK